MKKLFIVLSILLLASSCTDEQGARKALLDAGYKPIQVGGYGFLEASKGDTFVTKFKAYSPNDSSRIVQVSFVVDGLKGRQ